MREKFEQLRAFLQEVLQEVRRVTWPSPRELAGATMVVIITTGVTVALLAFYDLVVRVFLGAVGVMQ